MDKFSVVCWLWGQGYTTKHVNVLYAAAQKFLPSHDFYCITDRSEGFDNGVKLIPIWDEEEGLQRRQRRLRLFSREVSNIVGKRILQLDIDTLIVAPIGPELIETETLMTIWRCPSIGRHGYALNPSFMFFKADQLHFIWEDYIADWEAQRNEARNAGWTGNDQAVIGHRMHDKPIKTVGVTDGFYSWRDHDCRALPPDARLVSFYGNFDQAHPQVQVAAPWIKEHWSCV